jgi:hypothetical protein
MTIDDLPGPLNHRGHRGVPVRFPQLAPVPDQRPGQPVGRMVRLPAEQALGTQTATVDPVLSPAPDPHDPPAGDRDVHPAAVRAQHTGRLHPPLNLLLTHGQEPVHPLRPAATGGKRRALTPDLGNAIHHDLPPLSSGHSRDGRTVRLLPTHGHMSPSPRSPPARRSQIRRCTTHLLPWAATTKRPEVHSARTPVMNGPALRPGSRGGHVRRARRPVSAARCQARPCPAIWPAGWRSNRDGSHPVRSVRDLYRNGPESLAAASAGCRPGKGARKRGCRGGARPPARLARSA